MAENHLQVLASWQQEPTSSRAIGDALSNLWRDAAQSRQSAARGDANETEPLIRTSVLNFVVCTDSQGVAERARDVLAHLTVTHPSRTIAIVARPDDAGDPLGATLTAQCHPDAEGRPRLCCEQIDLTARGPTIAHLPGIVIQLLIHDLPTLLWWPGEPPIGDAGFSSLVQICDRVIVDSSDFGDPSGMLARLADFAASEDGRGALSDLNWNRLIDWREMLAQFFDAGPLRAYIGKIRRVDINSVADVGGQPDSAQALLLAGWLASRLDWEFDSVARESGACQIQLHDATGPIALEVAPTARRPGRPGSLASVRLTAGVGDARAVFSVEASDDGEHGTTRLELPGAEPVLRTVRLEPASESALISEEIEAFGRERAYGDALRIAGLLARAEARGRTAR